MICEIVCVGTEMLMGNIVNTNAAFLAKELSAVGVNNYFQIVVGDNEERMYHTIQTALNRSDMVILCGGLGPTKDDLTKEVTAKVLNKQLVMDEKSKSYIANALYKRMGAKEITENNWKQAVVIEGAEVIKNNNGLAPGIIVTTEENKKVILLPGPPGEFIPMVKNDIIPYIKKLSDIKLYSKMVKICGIGESKAETLIEDLIEGQTNPTIAPYAKTSEVHFRVTASCKDDKEGEACIKTVMDELYKRFGNHIYTTDEEETLVQVVVNQLKDKKLTLAVAESCTGGMLSSSIIDLDGVSVVYKEGFITYSNEAKMAYLGVKKETLDSYGAVSKETAYEMARGVLNATGSDVSIAITGIAGPTGGTEEKPVGLVYIGIGVQGKIEVFQHNFFGSRQKVRESSVIHALNHLRLQLL